MVQAKLEDLLHRTIRMIEVLSGRDACGSSKQRSAYLSSVRRSGMCVTVVSNLPRNTSEIVVKCLIVPFWCKK